MAEYPVNKGIGRPVEFKGLKAQYLFIFCGGLLVLFILFVILYMVGIDQWVCIGFGAASSSLLVWQTFALNARYGEHGLMKLGAARSHPRYLINRRRITRRPQTGLVHQGTLQTGASKGRHELFEPFLRATLQRASVLEAHLLPLPDQDDKGA